MPMTLWTLSLKGFVCWSPLNPRMNRRILFQSGSRLVVRLHETLQVFRIFEMRLLLPRNCARSVAWRSRDCYFRYMKFDNTNSSEVNVENINLFIDAIPFHSDVMACKMVREPRYMNEMRKSIWRIAIYHFICWGPFWLFTISTMLKGGEAPAWWALHFFLNLALQSHMW